MLVSARFVITRRGIAPRRFFAGFLNPRVPFWPTFDESERKARRYPTEGAAWGVVAQMPYDVRNACDVTEEVCS